MFYAKCIYYSLVFVHCFLLFTSYFLYLTLYILNVLKILCIPNVLNPCHIQWYSCPLVCLLIVHIKCIDAYDRLINKENIRLKIMCYTKKIKLNVLTPFRVNNAQSKYCKFCFALYFCFSLSFCILDIRFQFDLNVAGGQ